MEEWFGRTVHQEQWSILNNQYFLKKIDLRQTLTVFEPDHFDITHHSNFPLFQPSFKIRCPGGNNNLSPCPPDLPLL
jgi:hypothetical protein